MKHIASYSAGATLIGAIVGGWLFLDSHFAKAMDVQQAVQSLEQSTLYIRLDILDWRLQRELEKPDDRQDDAKIIKLESQIRRLENRLDE